MIIYPTIEIQNGRCVSLHRGRLEEPSIWHVDPVEKAKEFAQRARSGCMSPIWTRWRAATRITI